MALTGNKADLADKRKVEAEVGGCAGVIPPLLTHSLQEAQAYAEENNLYFMETSAKTAANVNGASTPFYSNCSA